MLITGCILMIFSAYAQLNHFNDTTYFFTFDYPDTWKQTGKSGENLRTALISPDEKYFLVAYGFFTESGHYDLEKFAENDTNRFSRLGKVKATKINAVVPYIGKYLAFFVDGADEILDIRKKYGPNSNGYYAYTFFTTDEHYAYALIAYSKSDDFSKIEPVFESFDKTASWKTTRMNNLSGAHLKSTAQQIIFWVIVVLYFSVLMFSGRNFKKWSRRKKALNKFRDNLDEGMNPDHKWKNAQRNATKKIVFSILLFALLAIPGIFLYHSGWFIYFAVPASFILGYMGYSLTVPDPS